MHVHFIENNFMILGGFATTFPNEMKPSNLPSIPKNNNNVGRKVKKAGMRKINIKVAQ